MPHIEISILCLQLWLGGAAGASSAVRVPVDLFTKVTWNRLDKLSVNVLYLFRMLEGCHCIHWTSTIRDLDNTVWDGTPVVLDFIPAPDVVVSNVHQLV